MFYDLATWWLHGGYMEPKGLNYGTSQTDPRANFGTHLPG